MNDMLSPELDFTDDATLSGFRLERLEVLNWGTFDGEVRGFDLGGRNALLTGDIGSGKSTLVDAVTTLLVPPNKVAYNRAAGAGARERSLRSYVLGYYKSERDDGGASGKPVALRDTGTYSVILGRFRNRGYDSEITLAQVFRMREAEGQPTRFYVGAERALSIAEHFASFGDDVAVLRKRLKADGAQVFDSFPPYGSWFRRRFGIEDEQALDLFHQTVSMKSVGDLTGFVRGHMLERFDVEPRIDALLAHFDDLNRAHEAVVRARRRIALLEPLIAECDRHASLTSENEALRADRDGLESRFATLKLELLERRLERLADERHRAESALGNARERRDALTLRVDELKGAIGAHGGDRLATLATAIEAHGRERDRRQARQASFAELATRLELAVPEDEPAWLDLRSRLDAENERLEAREAESQNALTEATVALRDGRVEHERLDAEIRSLEARRSNIPARQDALREALCEALGVTADVLPFAGELLRVRDDERDWEGAAERLLGGFALSLLVPDARYAEVVDWVDRTFLGGNRLVYYRVREGGHAGHGTAHDAARGGRRDAEPLDPDALARKLEVRRDSAFADWLERETERRFDHVCCRQNERFRRERRAITLAGQVKSGGGRHEKDDRSRLDDRSRYVLGWSNEGKLAALRGERERLADQLLDVAVRVEAAKRESHAHKAEREALGGLRGVTAWREIDWRSVVLEIDALQRERDALERSSDVLAQLDRELGETRTALAAIDAELEQAQLALGEVRARTDAAEALATETRVLADDTFDRARFDALHERALGSHRLTVESCDNRQRELRVWLQGRIDAGERRLDRAVQSIVSKMERYRNEFPLESQEVDANVAAADEYRAMLAELAADDLPRFEDHFKELLNENTIREIANFQSQLNREREGIRERVARINASLAEIDYNPGRFIRLEARETPERDVRDFRDELRKCTEGTLSETDDDHYSEKKFLQVRAIIERFAGREGTAELDKRWTARVTDVRNWFAFAASERWREDDVEHEHYSDSGGKSGGQKEKLAYTILAASLAYRFGLEWGAGRSRSFRFVVIDEAFGRGSDESAEFGLRLFDRLELQLLIVTPLQKIHIIEPWVSSVGYVTNPDGAKSRLRNLTIEEYREEKRRRAAPSVTPGAESPAVPPVERNGAWNAERDSGREDASGVARDDG